MHYMVSLGPSTVLDLSESATKRDNTIFMIARDMRWHKWKRLPVGASRAGFFKDAVEAVIREHQTDMHYNRLDVLEQKTEQRKHRLSRGTNLANEMKHVAQRQTLNEMDRSMNTWVDWINSNDQKQVITRLTTLETASYFFKNQP